MKTVYDVQQLLKRFGIYIYTGNREADLQLMGEEIKELHDIKVIAEDVFTEAMFILQEDIKVEQQKWK